VRPMYSHLTDTPDVDELVVSPERAALSLLAAAASSARNALIAAHKPDLLAMGDNYHDADRTPAIALVAMRVSDTIGDLMESLLLYDATVRDIRLARAEHDELF